MWSRRARNPSPMALLLLLRLQGPAPPPPIRPGVRPPIFQAAWTREAGGNKGGGGDGGRTDQLVLLASQALLSAVVLRAPPLTGERIRGVTRATKRDLARAVEKGDTAAAADLCLLQHPSDPRPCYLLRLIYFFSECMEESDIWNARYERLAAGSLDEDRAAHVVLKEEMVIALMLGGALTACHERFPGVLRKIVGAAGSRVDAALVSTLCDKNTPVVERLELRVVRAFVYAVMWSAVKNLDGGGGITMN